MSFGKLRYNYKFMGFLYSIYHIFVKVKCRFLSKNHICLFDTMTHNCGLWCNYSKKHGCCFNEIKKGVKHD